MVYLHLQPARAYGVGWRIPYGSWSRRLCRRNASPYQLWSDGDCDVRLPLVPSLQVTEVIDKDTITSRDPSPSEFAMPIARHDQYLGFVACIRRWHDSSFQLQVSHGSLRNESLRR
jgi:hypothetical protein